jgi:hypothetical protein
MGKYIVCHTAVRCQQREGHMTGKENGDPHEEALCVRWFFETKSATQV